MRRLLPLAPIALLAGCGLFSSVDTDKLERDIQARLVTQPQGAPLLGAPEPQGTGPPAVSVSCPSNVSNKRGARFRCSATITRFNAGPTTPTTPSTPSLSAPAPQTQRYAVDVRVVDDAGAVRWSTRPVD